jgi:hypothetical protein
MTIGKGNQILYYRKPVWSQIIRLGFDELRSHFIPIRIDSEIEQHTQLNPQLVRYATQPNAVHNNDNWCVDLPPTRAFSHPTYQPSQMNPSIPSTAHSSLTAAVQESRKRYRKKIITHLKKFPTVRFLPKKNKLRSITNLRGSGASSLTQDYKCETVRTGETAAIISNSMLQNGFFLLSHLFYAVPHGLGFGVKSLDDIYLKYRHYVDVIEARQGKQQESASRLNGIQLYLNQYERMSLIRYDHTFVL